MAIARELRGFLDQCVNSVAPITLVDRWDKTHLVNITSANEVVVHKPNGQDETALQLLLVEAQAETLEAGSTGARAQEIFLLQALDGVVPQEIVTDKWGKVRVFLLQMERQPAHSRKAQADRSYVLTFVDAWGGVYIYEVPKLKITSSTTLTLATHNRATNGYGYGHFGFGQYEV